MPQPNDGIEGTDGWLREQIAEILQHGWTLDELESIGITRSLLIRLGFRDDHPALFEEPQPRGPSRPDPGGPRQPEAKKAASPTRRDAASSFGGGKALTPARSRRLKPRLERPKVRLRGLPFDRLRARARFIGLPVVPAGGFIPRCARQAPTPRLPACGGAWGGGELRVQAELVPEGVPKGDFVLLLLR